jgi:hypothetical protein
MVKHFDYKIGQENPFASIEVNYLSKILTPDENKIFDAWEKNEKKYPVNKL